MLEVYPAADRLRFLNLPGTVSSARDPVTGKEVHVQINLTLDIQFSDGTPVIQTLQKIQAGVADTLEAFKPEFERSGAAHSAPP
jgi:hypothetical protein